MRIEVIAGAALAGALLAGAADAQRFTAHGPAGAGVARPAAGARWGAPVNGHFAGAMRAPGGLGAYHRPYRGYALPRYWRSRDFFLNDFAFFGLPTPPLGYNWYRYYDDAVLLDDNGSVYDTVDGIDWTGGYAGGAGEAGYDGGYGQGMAGADYPPPPEGGYDHDAYRRNSGATGALVGGGVGALAGSAIAGRGSRVGGALIGAGVGAAAGYAIDRQGYHHDRHAPPPPYGAGYPAPPPGPGYGAGYPPPPAPGYGPQVIHADGGTTVTTTTAGGYYGGATTTVTVVTAPVVTTTTEVVEDTVTYSKPVVRKVWRRPVYRPRCGCAVVRRPAPILGS